ncbi:MAG TPA: metallophosphoesterase [Actinoplanes sp.]|jgi:predicted phosphodiesterase
MTERVAFVGDLHMNTEWARRAIRHALDQGARMICQLGDYGYTFAPDFVEAVEEELQRGNAWLLFVDGNHEDFPKLYDYPTTSIGLRAVSRRVAHMPRGYRWEWGGVRFLAMGGAYSVDRKFRVPGVSWWAEETITPRQVAEAAEPGPVDVLISHDCPAGVVIPGIDDRETLPSWLDPLEVVRSQEHRGRLRELTSQVKPSVIWHGHYHVRHRTVADLGYGPVVVNGLAEDESSLDDNVAVVDVADILVRS